MGGSYHFLILAIIKMHRMYFNFTFKVKKITSKKLQISKLYFPTYWMHPDLSVGYLGKKKKEKEQTLQLKTCKNSLHFQ